MAFHVRDAETDRIVRELAAVKGASITETIREACRKELADSSRAADRERRLAAIEKLQDEIAALPDSGEVIDKAFFDSLNDE